MGKNRNIYRKRGTGKSQITCAGCGNVFTALICLNRKYCSDCGYGRGKGRPALSDEARKELFWSRVRKAGEDECWPWFGGIFRGGYGAFFVNGKVKKAHRMALEIFLGRPIQHGLLVIHSCDNPPCCNPRHLREGTVRDNAQDMMNRKRYNWNHPKETIARGNQNGSRKYPERLYRGKDASLKSASKLTEKTVLEIRAYRKNGVKLKILAVMYGVAEAQISRAANGVRWSWLKDGL